MGKVTINPISTVQLLNPKGEVTKEFKAKVEVNWERELGKEDKINVTITAQEEEEMNPCAIFETERTYYYPTKYGIKEVVIEQPRELRVSESGHHYVTTASGLKEIMPPGWIRITVLAD